MIPAIPYSFGSVTSFTISSPVPSKESPASRFNGQGRIRKSSPFLPRAIVPHSLGYTLLQKHKLANIHSSRSKIQALAAVGSEVAVDESNPTIAEEPIAESEAATPAPKATNQGRRQRAPRKSEMPPVKAEDLLVGASFTGKIRSIQPFGAFVDFGAFTDGLVHVSNLSNGFVKDVASFVTVGQEVKVKILEVNNETGRISLTMRDGEESKPTRSMQRGDEGSEPSSKPRSPRKSNQKREGGNQKTSKFVKDQVLDGTVKNITRSGAYISLPEGEEGFLPNSEESEGISVMGSSSLQVGQEVNVRVLRVSRGQVTLTMKKEEDMAELNKLLNQGVVYAPRNPFELAFRKNKDIASYLDEREKAKQSPEPEPVVEETLGKVVEEEASEVSASQGEESSVEAVVEEEKKEDESAAAVTDEPASAEASADVPPLEDASLEAVAEEENKEPEPAAVENTTEEVVTEEPASAEASTGIPPVEDASSEAVAEEEKKEPEPATAETIPEPLVEEPATAEASADIPPVEDSSSEAVAEEETKEPEPVAAVTPEAVEQVAEEPASAEASSVEDTSSETVAEEENKVDEPVAAITPEAKKIPEEQVTEEPVSQETSPAEAASSAAPLASAISPSLVKQLREESGAGMMECKKALEATNGDLVKAQEFLRKKGLASADKKSERATAEGRIASYIHDNRIGVLVEVNCETDFVSRGNIFKDLVEDIAMQVAACPQVEYLSTEDVPDELINKEREIELQKEDLQSKPEQFRSKIVEGRMKKRLEELALLEQPYIKNDKVVIRDLVKQTIATIGENIKVKRFIRFNLGEGLEKKNQDFAAEVAAQTAAKAVTAKPVEEKPEVAVEAPPAEDKPVVAISAALVKQLREETGAGMMECKKALAESSGDVVKAQEYLRKKGLSSADKKASRVAAEGRVGSYIHDSRIGVLIEVNCETDFVGRSENFKQLVDDLAMQVAACPQVKFVSLEDIPQEFVAKEKEIEMQREDLVSKPENIREKIVEGRISKRLGETVLLEQPFIKDDSVLVKDLVKQTVAALGENIRVRRFARFTLGESSD